MIWRAWIFAVGLPLGALSTLALLPTPSLAVFQLGAVAGGALLATVAWLVSRWRDDDPERGQHLAKGASAGLVAVPALGAALLGLAPGPAVLLAGSAAVLALGLYRGARVRGPAGGPAVQIGVAAAALVGGGVVVGATAGAAAALDAPSDPELRSERIYELDAQVPTQPLPRCEPRPARVSVLPHPGAHPRLGPEGKRLWYDARAGDGSRQVFSLDRASGESRCWTCEEPGNNLRPAPGDSGAVIAFDTDRHASWRSPNNTEVHILPLRTADRAPSRRLTRSPGRDDHAVLGPGSRTLLWSHDAGGYYTVVSSSVVQGHGGVVLSGLSLVASGGAAWAAPLAWSPDARTLVVARGNPYAPLRGVAIDPATDRRSRLRPGLAGAASASFSADGGWVALASARRGRALGLLPGAFGFALGAVAASAGGDGALYRTTEVYTGKPRGELARVDLGDVARWGAPTGLALEPDGTGFVLGQRRNGGDGPSERLVEVALDCRS